MLATCSEVWKHLGFHLLLQHAEGKEMKALAGKARWVGPPPLVYGVEGS